MAEFDILVFRGLYLVAQVLTLWAFADALFRPAANFVAMSKLTKPVWAAITGVAAVVVYAFGVMSFLGLPALIAALVYLVDVRPAVRGLQRGNNSW